MEQLVRAAIDGQQEAFEQLAETEKPKLLSKAYSYVGNREDASDIVQETLLQAYKSIQPLKLLESSTSLCRSGLLQS